jgi:Lrp/AsnC family leucine-responsive transcriptional regulator
MNSSDHTPFRRFITKDERIAEAHRVSGEGCYWLKASLASHHELNQLLEEILRHGNYRLNLSIGGIK